MNQRKRKHANVPCISLTLNAEMLFELFKLKFFQGSLSHCVHVRQTHLTMSNRMQFCVCVSTIAKHERFRLRSKRNEHPFAQSDAVGSAENYCVFFFFGSLFLFSSQQKRKSEHIKLHNLSILPIDTHNMGHVTNYLTCTAMTPFGTFNGDNVLKKKAAFTLAEVLITLGIIGIVAAMTMPALIQRNINHTAEARLKKFYSVFNQAIQLAEAEYGDRTFWYSDIGGVQLDENGNPIEAPRKLISGFKNISLNSSPTKKKSKKTAV